MPEPSDTKGPVWDGPTRWFHWINVVLVFVSVLSGLFFLWRESFHVEGREAKMALKALHSWIGYVWLANLSWRAVWGFMGNSNARWRAVLPDREALRLIGPELRALIERRPRQHRGRSPVSRLSATVMFAMMLILATTGVIRAGTDLYHLPLGPVVAAYVAGSGVDASLIDWRTETELADPEKFRTVTGVKTVTGKTHEALSYLLLAWLVLHIGGVTLSEVRQRSGLVSSMIHGGEEDS